MNRGSIDMAETLAAQALILRWADILAARAGGEVARRRVERRWRRGKVAATPHGLPGQLIVSLTSFSRRFRSLHCTLKCLLDQSIAPDAVILWLSEDDRARLPANVTSLQAAGLIVRTTMGLGSYNKIIPTLDAYPEAYIATADDDAYYDHRWLEELVREARFGQRQIICHRAHGVRLNAKGLPLPYVQWDYELRRPEVSRRVFPTGVGGVLYPPGVLHQDVVDPSLYGTLCPMADDVWLYWMALQGGATFRKVGPRRTMVLWPGSQRVSLSRVNVMNHGNDRQIGNLVARFGFPGL